MQILDRILGYIEKHLPKYEELKNVPIEVLTDSKISTPSLKKLKVLILNAPCHGFGDIVFAMKLAQFVKEWYGCTVHIATTSPEGFIQLGVRKSKLLKLETSVKDKQCRRFKKLTMVDMNGKSVDREYDVLLVAPVQSDFTPNYKDVRSLIPYSDVYNTFFFSEYNGYHSPLFHFNTGVGGDKCGMLFTRPPKGQKPSFTRNRYALVYIAVQHGAIDCLLSFVGMVVKKYRKYRQFEIVVPGWYIDEIQPRRLKNLVTDYYDNIMIISREGDDLLWSRDDDNDGSMLYIRGDILPVNNREMLNLIKYSVRDILLTGDQSITDALSCCGMEKNIFYQIRPWKKSLANGLAKHLPNAFLRSKATSCGGLASIKYKSNYKKFLKQWDFRRLARPRLTAIMKMCMLRKSDTGLQAYIQASSRKTTTAKVVQRIHDLL
jgi:hypothetical protein